MENTDARVLLQHIYNAYGYQISKNFKDNAIRDAFELADKALEKQIPKKVKNSGERIPFEWYCPTCGEILCDDGYKNTDIKYCEQCGQVLDWRD
jgi:ribosomal protein L33|nr:MAG TPA: hydrogenase/urease nickel incorporation protein [Bacteriophage sp.]